MLKNYIRANISELPPLRNVGDSVANMMCWTKHIVPFIHQ
jgi:hypothetical protein